MSSQKHSYKKPYEPIEKYEESTWLGNDTPIFENDWLSCLKETFSFNNLSNFSWFQLSKKYPLSSLNISGEITIGTDKLWRDIENYKASLDEIESFLTKKESSLKYKIKNIFKKLK